VAVAVLVVVLDTDAGSFGLDIMEACMQARARKKQSMHHHHTTTTTTKQKYATLRDTQIGCQGEKITNHATHTQHTLLTYG
jgi:hypothetical protein